jgi:hypothetical protein
MVTAAKVRFPPKLTVLASGGLRTFAKLSSAASQHH